MNHHFKWLALALLLFSSGLFSSGASYAQTPNSGSAISGVTINRSTKNVSVVITTGGTFQTVLTSILGTSTVRQALTIENNNTTDNCYLFIGTGTPTAATSILLLPGGSYTRYWPYVPSDTFQATCASGAEPDSLYIDVQ
jgi:hypothetical protein